MDSFLATGLGLCVRLLVDTGSRGDVRVGGTLVGIWEGVVLHHFINKTPKSLDPYLAYGIRLLLDLILTKSVTKTILVILWTGLSVMASDVVVGPTFANRSRPKSVRPKPPQTTIDPKFRFYHSKAPLQLPPPSLQSASIITPQATSAPSLPTFPPSNSTWSEINNDSQPALPLPPPELSPELTSEPGHPLPPSPISLTPHEKLISDAEILPSEEQHDDASPHIKHSFLGDDDGGADLSPTTSSNIRYLPEPEDASCPAELLTLECSVMPQEGRFAGGERLPEVHHDSDYDHTPTNQPVLLPDAPDNIETCHPEDSMSTLAVDLQIPPAEAPIKKEDDDIAPLPIMIQPVIPVPSFSDNRRGEATDPTGDTLLDTSSVPESEQTRAERESTISAGNRETLISRGDSLRAKAVSAEREMTRLENEYKRALSENRRKDALLLEGEVEQASDKAKKLHERAARRYFRAHNLTPEPLTVDVHRLRVHEAVRVTRRAIRETLLKGGTQLRVIVGQGFHSRQRTPVLKYKIKLEMQR